MDGESDATTQQQGESNAPLQADESAQAHAETGATDNQTSETPDSATQSQDAGVDTTTLNDGEIQQLAALGYSQADIDAATTMLGAERAAERFREHAKNALEHLRTLAPKGDETQTAPAKGAAPAAPSKPASPASTEATANQALAEQAAGELLTADQIKAIGDAYGDEIVTTLVKPMQAALKSQAAAFEKRMAGLEQSISGIKLQPALDGFDAATKAIAAKNPALTDLVGPSWADATEEQTNTRMELADHALAIRDHQAKRGIRISPTEALNLAVAVKLGQPIPAPAAIRKVQEQVKNRSAARSIPPSAGKAKPAGNTSDPLDAAKRHVADFFKNAKPG